MSCCGTVFNNETDFNSHLLFTHEILRPSCSTNLDQKNFERRQELKERFSKSGKYITNHQYAYTLAFHIAKGTFPKSHEWSPVETLKELVDLKDVQTIEVLKKLLWRTTPQIRDIIQIILQDRSKDVNIYHLMKEDWMCSAKNCRKEAVSDGLCSQCRDKEIYNQI